MQANDEHQGFIIKTVRTFLSGPLSMIFISLAVLLGIMAIFYDSARRRTANRRPHGRCSG